jgi:hypothetical protein
VLHCRYATRKPYGEWLKRQVVSMQDLLSASPAAQGPQPLLADSQAPQGEALLSILKPLKAFG